MKKTNILAFILTISMLFSQNAFAKRLGGGGSYGMQRSSSHQNYSQPPRGYSSYGQNYTNPQTTGQRSGMGAGTAAALGAAAGAAGGYMIGRSMANNGNNEANESNNHQQAGYANNNSEMGSHIPWGIIAILGILLAFGLMFFRKNKIAPNNNLINQNNNNGFNNTAYTATNTGNTQTFNGQQNTAMNNNAGQAPIVNSMNKMPDGIETIYFLRQVKGMFLHIQSMNNVENINEIAKYMTPELYNEIRNSVSNNNSIADFNNLDCQLLDCEMENNQLVASVKFFGLVSEEANTAATTFSEIWNFVKVDLNTNKWLVAGIQQETLN